MLGRMPAPAAVPSPPGEEARGPSHPGWAVGFLGASLLLISVGHYLTPAEHYHWHVIYQQLYYLPILLGAIWYGLRGGVLTAAAASVLYIPHILLHWAHVPLYRFSQIVSILMFLIFGALGGHLIDNLRREREAQRRTAIQLQRANEQLHATFERLRLIDRLSALGVLSAGMAHEIRNPLGSIAGAIEILEREVDRDDPKREFVGILEKEIQRLSAIVTRFLDLVKPSQVEQAPENLAEIVRSVVALTSKQAAMQNVSVIADARDGLADVMVDGQLIRQAVLNLVINAIQAMPGGGTVHVRPEMDEEHARILVEDDGPGLSEEALRRGFEPFYTTKPGGTGLGLSIAFQVATGHQGDLRAENRGGGGARFVLELPRRPAPGPAEGRA
jgi:two-component system sensor histidine kinase HydH